MIPGDPESRLESMMESDAYRPALWAGRLATPLD
jgi:hypothetical protein